MALINVNDTYGVPGKITVSRTLVEDEIKIEGVFASHYYFEEITELESDRYKITGIEVVEERFGSDDFDILYIFSAKAMEIADGLTNLTDKELDICEEKLYTEKRKFSLESNLRFLDEEQVGEDNG